MRYRLSVFFWFCLASGALASGYSDLNTGIAALNERRFADAIQYLSAATHSPDLPPQLRPVAYLDRADAYAELNRSSDASADCDTSIHLRPGWFVSLEACGIVHSRMDDDAGAVALFTSAIAAMPDRAEGYVERADSYANQGNFDAGIADDTKAIALNPDSAVGLTGRARLYELAGRYDLALKDSSDAVDIVDSYDLVRSLGIAQWAMGHFDDAASSFRRSERERRDDLYSLIWLDLAEADQDPAAKPEPPESGTDLTAWPAPLLEYFLGRVTADAAFAAIVKDDTTRQRQQTCEANFYIGEWRLIHKSPDPAKLLIAEAARSCPKDFIEYVTAKIEMKHLGSAP